jgi:hypothetical protein
MMLLILIMLLITLTGQCQVHGDDQSTYLVTNQNPSSDSDSSLEPHLCSICLGANTQAAEESFILETGDNPSSQDCTSDSTCSNPSICSGNLTGCNFFVRADLLFWNACEDGLSGCCGPTEIEDFETEEKTVISTSTGKNADPHFSWRTGYRVGFGLEGFCSFWDFEALWTDFYTKGHKDQNVKDDFPFFSDSNSNIDPEPFNEATGLKSIRIHFNTIDVKIGRNFQVCNDFNIEPFLGVRGARIKQRLHSHFITVLNSFGQKSVMFTRKHQKQKFDGVGPFLGIEADWYLGCGFSLYGSVDAGVLYGRFKITTNEIDALNRDRSICHRKRHQHACEAIADAALGLQWEHCFCNRLHLTLQIGAEHHRYFDQNKLCDYGDLCFDGGIFSVKIGI